MFYVLVYGCHEQRHEPRQRAGLLPPLAAVAAPAVSVILGLLPTNPTPPCACSKLSQLPPGHVPVQVRLQRAGEAVAHGVKLTLTFIVTTPGK